MSLHALALILATLVLGELLGRIRDADTARWSALALLIAGAWAIPVAGGSSRYLGQPGFAVLVVAGLGAAMLLSRPPRWRDSQEMARLVETVLLVAIAFTARDLGTVAVAWLASFVPGLRWREQVHVSRRPLALLAALGSVPVVAAVAAADFAPPAALYVGFVIGGALRMGVMPASPLLLANYHRLPLGRVAFVAAVRPSVPLIIAARAELGAAVATLAPVLQTWAGIAAVVAALQGISQREPRRAIGAMAATQAAIILYGLVSTEDLAVQGAVVQWAALGISLVGVGIIVDVMENRLGREAIGSVHGLLGTSPGMALLFLLFGATMSGFPGTAGFVGEDLILTSHAEDIGPALVLLFATTLNGVTMLQMFASAFLGPPSVSPEHFPALTVRERLVLGGLALALGVLTVFPGKAALLLQ